VAAPGATRWSKPPASRARVALNQTLCWHGTSPLLTRTAGRPPAGLGVIVSISVESTPTTSALQGMQGRLVDEDIRVIVLFCSGTLGSQIMLSSYQASPNRIGGA